MHNKNCLITGAAGLLGEQHAEALLEAGANLVITDIDFKKLKSLRKKLKKKFQDKVILDLKMDVTNEKSIINVKRLLKKKKLVLNVLINNAAIDPKIKKTNKFKSHNRFENVSLLQWKEHLDVGLTGAMLCSKILGEMISNNKQGGVILNIASDLSVIAPNHEIYEKNFYKPIMYSVVKHGLIGLTKYLSTYWNKKNVRCNALSPGPVNNLQPKTFLKKIKKHIPLNRLANKNEYKEVIKFLCSDSSSYMTGQNIVMDGGRSVW